MDIRPMRAPVIEISGLSYSYPSSDNQCILSDIDLNIDAGQIVILTGPSGSGKTTLLTIMGALRSAKQGSVRVLGHQLAGMKSHQKLGAVSPIAMDLRQKIGFIFQNHNLIKALTAQNNVEMALELDGGLSADRAEKAQAILKRLGLGDRGRHYPNQLSGGQRQRVAIARALVRAPALILADEPTASLDFQSSLEVMACLKEAAHHWGTTSIIVTHDQRLMGYADQMIALEDGAIVSHTFPGRAC